VSVKICIGPTLLIFFNGKFMKYQEDSDFDQIISAVENF